MDFVSAKHRSCLELIMCAAIHHLVSGILERSNTVPTVTVNWPLHSLQ